MAESLCRAPEKRKQFPEATTAISYEMTLQTYCQRLLKPSFWGGEPELLVLAKIVRRPIVVYIPAAKVKSAGTQVRSISHWSPYDRVGVVNADP